MEPERRAAALLSRSRRRPAAEFPLRALCALVCASVGGACADSTSPEVVMVVTGVHANNGPLAGGTAVIVTGANLPPTFDSVRFGSRRLVNVTWLSGKCLRGITPAGGAPGAVDVTLHAANARTAVCAGCFTYNPVITVTSVSPAYGGLGGGTPVTIEGTDFPAKVDSVRVGAGLLQGLTRLSGTQLTGTTPEGILAGTVDVTVYSTSAGSGTCAGCFTYTPARTVTVTGVSPNSGPLGGGTAVTITGTGFPATVDSVRLGAGRLKGLARVSGTQLTGTAPAALAPGGVDVTVYTTGAGSGACTGCFTYKPTLTGIWASIAASSAGTCALTNAGAAYCWGSNIFGQVGDGTTTERWTPVSVAGGITFASLSANGELACGLTSTGVAYCWGNDGLTLNHTGHTTPFAVPGAITFAAIAAGGFHACGLTTGGAAYCWGRNFYGQLGDGATTDRSAPTAVAGGIGFASLAASDVAHTCGVTSAGTAFCWGYNFWGALGIGPIAGDTSESAPVAVVGPRFTSLTAGSFHTCGLTSDGVAYCWGQNDYGQVGDGSRTTRWSPVAVVGRITFVSLTAGGVHTCGLTGAGVAYCWGSNGFGELGDGTRGDRLVPGAVVGGIAFTRLSAGNSHTCGLTIGGAAYCWGDGRNGELGTGRTISFTTPALVVGP